MSTMMVETTRMEAAAVIPEPLIASAPATFQLVNEFPVAPALEEVTFFDDRPLVPVFVIGAISLILSLAIVGSIVFWLAIRYSGVLAP